MADRYNYHAIFFVYKLCAAGTLTLIITKHSVMFYYINHYNFIHHYNAISHHLKALLIHKSQCAIHPAFQSASHSLCFEFLFRGFIHPPRRTTHSPHSPLLLTRSSSPSLLHPPLLSPSISYLSPLLFILLSMSFYRKMIDFQSRIARSSRSS